MNSHFARDLPRHLGVTALLVAVAALVAVAMAFAQPGGSLEISITEMLIRMVVVVGIYTFIGNSGVVSFGHVAFMCIGAYAAAWAVAEPQFKQMTLTGLPSFLQDQQYSFATSIAFSAALPAAVALVFGAAIMRLNGIAASIATFAFFEIVNNVYSNWDSVTAGVSSIVGIQTAVGPWTALLFALAAIVAAYAFQSSRHGLMVRGSRDEEVASQACGVSTVRSRLVAFVASAALCGVGGGLYAQFLGSMTIDTFNLNLAFVTLAMLVVGGIGSLAGAVSGVVVVTVIVEVLRAFEQGVPAFGSVVAIPQGSQEIGLGALMAAIMIYRPTGLTGSKEIRWTLLPRAMRAATAPTVAAAPAPATRAPTSPA